MNCGECGAWTSVRETRKADRGFSVMRTRECANGHTFVTFEVLPACLSPRRRRTTVVAAEARALRAWRNAQIVRACKTRTMIDVATEFGVSRPLVSKIVLAARRAS